MTYDSSPAGGVNAGIPYLPRGRAGRSGRECLACGERKLLSEYRLIGGRQRSAVCFACAAIRPDLDTTRHEIRRRSKRREKSATVNREWARRNREKYLAHKAVESAVARGKLAKQPCERCGATRLVHAHHDDYSRRLDVMWLCPVHHAARHRELRENV